MLGYKVHNWLHLFNHIFILSRCEEALTKNKSLISSDQVAYQKELMKNYQSFVAKLEPLLERKFGQLRGSLRKKYVCFLTRH